MSIASRINEMTEHLRNDWDGIDKLGLDITEENSNDNLDKNIENIAPVLNRFYNQSSDKTDLAKNGVVGRTSQDGDPTPENPVEVNNISGDVEYKVTGEGISESFPLSLGDIELCNISDYKDRIYSQNGEFYLEKKTGKVVFDGGENWSINPSYTYNVFYRTLDNYARISNTQTTYCEYYKGIENTAGIVDFGNNYNNSIGVRTANDNIKDIYISNNSITSASDFKTWLSTHNTVVYYVLATPTTTKITQENYPTLYSQLQAIQEFLTKYKINKEFLLDYSSPEIEY